MKQSVANSRLDKRVERIEKMLEVLMKAQGLELPEAQVGGESIAPHKSYASDPKIEASAPAEAATESPAPASPRRRAKPLIEEE